MGAQVPVLQFDAVVLTHLLVEQLAVQAEDRVVPFEHQHLSAAGGQIPD